MRLSDTQRACVIEATIEPLMAFRRGFGRSKQGPFFALATVRALINSGHLRAYHPDHGRMGLRLSARAS